MFSDCFTVIIYGSRFNTIQSVHRHTMHERALIILYSELAEFTLDCNTIAFGGRVASFQFPYATR